MPRKSKAPKTKRAPKAKPPRQMEFHMQRELFLWFNVEHPEMPVQGSAAGAFFAGDNKQRAMQAAAMKAKGVTAGYPDLMVHYPGGDGEHGLGIELKYGTNKQQPAQELWEAKLKAVGYAYGLVYSVEEAQLALKDYLSGGRSQAHAILLE